MPTATLSPPLLWSTPLSSSSSPEPYLLLTSPRFPSSHAIHLTPIRLSDGSQLAHIYNQPDIGLRMFKTPYPFLPSDASSIIADWSANHASLFRTLRSPEPVPSLKENPFRAIRLVSASDPPDDGLLIGTCSLSPSFDKVTQSDRPRAKEIGFAVLKECSGMGIGGKVAEALMRFWEQWGGEEGRLETWVAFVETNNLGSLKLLSRLGFETVLVNPAGPWPECKGGGTRESARMERGRLDAELV